MTPAEFITRWNRNTQTERAASQSHFLDLCALFNHPTPNDDPNGEHFAFEKGATKSGGGQGYADVWKRDFFAWEYKGKHKDLVAAMSQVAQYSGALYNPPLLVACDMQTLVVRANFPGFPTQTHEIDLRRLDVPENLEVVRHIFFDPQRFKPVETEEAITDRAARDFADLAEMMRARGVDSLRVARFLDRCIFAFFAEDVKLLPGEMFSKLLQNNRYDPPRVGKLIGDLFSKMATGGDFGLDQIRHFNGNLFDGAAEEVELLELSQRELDELLRASGKHWQSVSPSVMGTLFERALDPSQRAQLGAHYTTEIDIKDLVEPVILEPLRQKWEHLKTNVGARLATPDGVTPTQQTANEERDVSGEASLAPTDAREIIENFRDELAAIRVLDPACGSGNFLFVALQGLLDLEALTLGFLAIHGLVETGEILEPRVRPEQFFGLEKNPYALDLAQTSLWVGYLQWRLRNGFDWPDDPILKSTANFKCMDAILEMPSPPGPFSRGAGEGVTKVEVPSSSATNDNAAPATPPLPSHGRGGRGVRANTPREPEWPQCDFIVGNPPFLGGKLMRRSLTDEYIEPLFAVWKDRVPAEADLCCYWFEKARAHIENGKCRRAGLVATQAIRGGANREVLKRIKGSGDIFYAVSDRDWRQDGAAVHISLIAFDNGEQSTRVLDGKTVPSINANLTSESDVTQAQILAANAGLSFMGDTKGGAFDISFSDAIAMLQSPNPHGQPNSDVIVPWVNGLDITRRPREMFIIDFAQMSEASAALYQLPFAHVRRHVWPQREENNREAYRRNWWRHIEARPAMIAALSSLPRYLATARVTKHRLFSWLELPTLSDSALIVFARDDDYFFGVLHSRAHEVWALAMGTRLEDRPRYTPTSCFETFPFPQPDDAARERISQAARELDALRSRWLNPPEWMREETLEFPARADGIWSRFVGAESVQDGIGVAHYKRLIPRDGEMTVYDARPNADGVLETRAMKLKDALPRRTLTNLYNERPAWLENAHRELDNAVFAAYNWSESTPGDEEILSRLLELNQLRKTG